MPTTASRRRVSLALLAAALLAATAACGSTVQVSRTQTLGADITQPDGMTDQSGAATSPTSPGGISSGSASRGTGASLSRRGSVGSGSTVGGATGSSGTSGSPGAGSATGAAAVPASGRGWDAKRVYVGVITTKDTQRVYGSYGANNVDPGDSAAQAAAVAKAINARGGILGRTVVLVVKDVQTLPTATDPTGTGQTVCTYFSQDHPVIAVWNINTQIDQVPTLRNCLAHARIPLFSTAARAVTDPELAALTPYYYQTIMVSWDALAPVLMTRLQAQGWFGKWDARLGRPGTAPVVVGILVDGTPEGTHVGQVLKAAVAKAGHGNAVVFQYSEASQGQSASVQKFSGSGVTHVIVTDVELTAFQTSAATQGYKPRYGITSYNDPYSNLEASGLTPAGANNGAMGVGWAPNLDVSDANDPGRTAGGKACDALMAKGGQSFSNKRLAHLYASSLCDTFTLLAEGARAGGGLTGDALRRGIAQIAPGFSPANGFTAALGQGRPYVQGSVRDLSWGSACSCFTYGKGGARLG